MTTLSTFSIRRLAITTGFVVAAAFASPVFADEVSTYVANGAAIGGTDPVAYHTMGKPVQGSDDFTTDYDGVTWKFSSAANRDAFAADPAKYAPAYGGFCATGASFGKKIPIDPQHFKIVDGTLYLNSSQGAHDRFLSDEPGTISKADMNWQEIRTTPADQL